MRLVHSATEILCGVFQLQDTLLFIELFNRDDWCCTWLLCIDFSLSVTKNTAILFFRDKYKLKFMLDLGSFSAVPFKDCLWLFRNDRMLGEEPEK